MEAIEELKNFPDIVTDKNKLSEISRPSSKDECDSIKIWDKLRNTLASRSDGIGLSAVQIGYPIRVALAILKEGSKTLERSLLNPIVVESSPEMIKFKGEGCLSFHGEYVNTVRHVWVKVKDDINGEVVYSGIESIVVQHEIDHMDGKTMFDRKVVETFVRQTPKIGRNEPCCCGSGKKFKKCCGK